MSYRDFKIYKTYHLTREQHMAIAHQLSRTWKSIGELANEIVARFERQPDAAMIDAFIEAYWGMDDAPLSTAAVRTGLRAALCQLDTDWITEYLAWNDTREENFEDLYTPIGKPEYLDLGDIKGLTSDEIVQRAHYLLSLS